MTMNGNKLYNIVAPTKTTWLPIFFIGVKFVEDIVNRNPNHQGGEMFSHEDSALNKGPIVPIQSVLPKDVPIEDKHVFRNVSDPEGWIVMEWTPATLEEIKKEGKMVVMSYNLNNYGKFCPEMRMVEKIEAPFKS